MNGLQNLVLTPELHKAVKKLERHCTHIGYMWTEWSYLFAPPMEHMKLMNDTCPDVFCMYRESVIQDIILHISKFTDESKNQPNDCLPWLRDNLPPGRVKDELANALIALKPKLKSIRKWRNKMIAHAESTHSLQDELLPEVHQALADVGEVIKDISNAINLVTMNVVGGDLARILHHTTTAKKGAQRLIHFLKDGLKLHQEQLEQNKKDQNEMFPG